MYNHKPHITYLFIFVLNSIAICIIYRKRWILIPPDKKSNHPSPMKPCRVPYEESSIYSGLDFYSPKKVKDFKGLIVLLLEIFNISGVI